MATSTWEIAAIVILLILVGVAGYSYFAAVQYKKRPLGKTGKTLADAVTTRGMNGVAGKTLELTCPAGQVISFAPGNATSTRGALICTGDAKCDGFYQRSGQNTTFFNPATTIDVFGAGSKFTGLAECEGKNECSWTIPSVGDQRLTGCLAKCQNLEFVGTYDCVAA